MLKEREEHYVFFAVVFIENVSSARFDDDDDDAVELEATMSPEDVPGSNILFGLHALANPNTVLRIIRAIEVSE